MIKKYRDHKPDPSPFFASDPPTHHTGVTDFVLAAPCLRSALKKRVSRFYLLLSTLGDSVERSERRYKKAGRSSAV
jgi:hypothetical protein